MLLALFTASLFFSIVSPQLIELTQKNILTKELTARTNLTVYHVVVIFNLALVSLTYLIIYYLTAQSRRREIGVLRCLGGKRGSIFKLLWFEALLLSCVGSGTGVILLFTLFKTTFRDFLTVVPPGQALVSACISMGVIIVLNLFSMSFTALSGAFLDPYEVIRS